MPQHTGKKKSSCPGGCPLRKGNVASSYGSKMGSNPKPSGKARDLTKTEKDLLKDHEKHHTKKHMDEMKKFMKAGKGCFADAHKHAMQKVGK